MIINMVSGGGGGGSAITQAQIQLNYPVSGLTITGTSGNLTKTAVTDANGLANIANVTGGSWTFTSPGGASVTSTITSINTQLALNISKVTASTTNTASTITASRSGYSSVTASIVSGTATFYDLAAGEWTFSDGTDSTTGTVVAGSEITINIGGLIVSIQYCTDYGDPIVITPASIVHDMSYTERMQYVNAHSDSNIVFYIQHNTAGNWIAYGNIQLNPSITYACLNTTYTKQLALSSTNVTNPSDANLGDIGISRPSSSSAYFEFTPVNIPTYYLFFNDD